MSAACSLQHPFPWCLAWMCAVLLKQGVSRLSLCKTPIVLLHEGPWTGGCSDHMCSSSAVLLVCIYSAAQQRSGTRFPPFPC